MKLPRGRALWVLAAAALLAATLAAFWPILGHGFVFDDFALIVENPGIRGLDAARLRWMLFSTYLTTYMPLGWAAFAAVFSLCGLEPAGYHAANLAAHWLVCVALFAAARRLFRLAGAAKPELAAFLAALLFCVHPFQVNTVAWAIELPDMLSTFCFLVAVFVYLGPASRKRTAAVLALYAASLLFRWRSLSLPIVLVGLDYWPLGRLRARAGDLFDRERVEVWAGKAPFLLLAIAAASITRLAKSHELYAPSFAPAAAARALWLYPWTLLWPKDYRGMYALQGGNTFGMPAWAALAAAAGVTAALWALRRRRPALLLVWAAYAAAVVPPALAAQSGSVYVYLAYGYLGCAGFFLLAGAAAARRPAGAAAAAVLALGLIAASRAETRHWRDQVAYWTRAVQRDPGFSPAQGQLGSALLAAGRYAEALPWLESRVAAAPWDEAAAAAKEEAARQAARAASVRPAP